MKIIKVRKYKAGYEIRTELYEAGDYGCDQPFEMKSAYTLSGDYIGDPKSAYWLCKKRGIKPEKAKESHNVCSIGYCSDRNVWAGWSHRAICEFGIGSKVKLGDCAFVPRNKEEYIKSLESWYDDELYKNVSIDDLGDKIVVNYEIHPINDGKIIHSTSENLLSEVQFGKGEWTAETMEDAKQMAIDFAEDVS